MLCWQMSMFLSYLNKFYSVLVSMTFPSDIKAIIIIFSHIWVNISPHSKGHIFCHIYSHILDTEFISSTVLAFMHAWVKNNYPHRRVHFVFTKFNTRFSTEQNTYFSLLLHSSLAFIYVSPPPHDWEHPLISVQSVSCEESSCQKMLVCFGVVIDVNDVLARKGSSSCKALLRPRITQILWCWGVILLYNFRHYKWYKLLYDTSIHIKLNNVGKL